MNETAEVGKREAELIAARRNNLAALLSRGADPFAQTRYDVTAHAEPDHFIHVQLGPYANRKDAEAMRNRLQADGYQPYIK